MCVFTQQASFSWMAEHPAPPPVAEVLRADQTAAAEATLAAGNSSIQCVQSATCSHCCESAYIAATCQHDFRVCQGICHAFACAACMCLHAAPQPEMGHCLVSHPGNMEFIHSMPAAGNTSILSSAYIFQPLACTAMTGRVSAILLHVALACV